MISLEIVHTEYIHLIRKYHAKFKVFSASNITKITIYTQAKDYAIRWRWWHRHETGYPMLQKGLSASFSCKKIFKSGRYFFLFCVEIAIYYFFLIFFAHFHIFLNFEFWNHLYLVSKCYAKFYFSSPFCNSKSAF